METFLGGAKCLIVVVLNGQNKLYKYNTKYHLGNHIHSVIGANRHGGAREAPDRPMREKKRTVAHAAARSRQHFCALALYGPVE